MEAKSVVRTGVAAILAVAVLAVAPGCGGGEGSEEAAAGSGGTGGAGGTGGTGGTGGAVEPEPTVEELCEASCKPMVACDLLPAEYLQECIELCVDDPAFDRERTEACVACLGEVECNDILFGCAESCQPPSHDLEVSLDAGDLPGELFVAVVDEHTGSIFQIASALVAEAGATVVELPAALAEKRSARIDAFLDTDLDGACTDGDRTWSVEVASPTAAVEVELSNDAPAAPDACGSFGGMNHDFSALGTGFGELDGKMGLLALKATWLGHPQTMQVPAVIENGSFGVAFGRVLVPEATFSFVWWIDVDGDGKCTPDGDLGGKIDLPAPYDTHVLVEFDRASAGAPACDEIFGVGYDLTLKGSGYGQFDGSKAQATLVHAETEEYRVSGEGRIAGGSFELTVEDDLAYGFAHKVSLWIDTSNDGYCGEGDAAWWIDIPATEGDLTTEINYSPAVDLDACSAQVQQSPF